MASLLLRPALAALVLGLALPAVASAHTLTERYQAPLPLVAYIGGAGLAVAMSFAFVMLRGQGKVDAPRRSDVRAVPGWLRHGLSAVGLIGWLWIIAQGFFGGSAGAGAADVPNLLLWVIGWIGVAILSAFGGPVWAWLDPFTTIHRLLSALGARLGVSGDRVRRPELPARLDKWLAVAGFAVVVWLELVAFVLGGRMLAGVLLAYTLLTLAGMSYFGREAWRARAEVFSVWFGLLNRLAPFGLEGEPEAGRVRRRPFAAALTQARWTLAEIVLLALGTGAIIYDGLSQTSIYFDLFYRPDYPLPPTIVHTLAMAAFLGFIVALVVGAARLLGQQAIGAGLLPVAIGYLVAHYLISLLYDGQLLVQAVNDPLVRGDNLLPYPLSDWQPTEFVPVALIWSIQLAAVVGGHVLGAWSGHTALSGSDAARPMRQLPLAALMVFLTSLTLWSLGQEVIAPEQPAAWLDQPTDQIAPTPPADDG